MTLPQQENLEDIGRQMVGSVVGSRKCQYLLEDVIGTGSFAIVFLATNTITGDRYALKCLFKHSLTREQIRLQRKELEFLLKLQHVENVVTLEDYFEDDDFLWLLLECCGMDLYDAVTSNGGFPTDVVKEVFSQICDGVHQCHELGIYHRDIKPENILISTTFRIRLADFGLGCQEEFSTEYGCGSVRYMAPECLNPQYASKMGYSTASNDCWSLGVILINLLFGKNPWHEASDTDPIYSSYIGKNPRILKQQFKLTGEFDMILRRVFCAPENRCTVFELKQMVEKCSAFTTSNSTPVLERVSEEVPRTSFQDSPVFAYTEPYSAPPSSHIEFVNAESLLLDEVTEKTLNSDASENMNAIVNDYQRDKEMKNLAIEKVEEWQGETKSSTSTKIDPDCESVTLEGSSVAGRSGRSSALSEDTPPEVPEKDYYLRPRPMSVSVSVQTDFVAVIPTEEEGLERKKSWRNSKIVQKLEHFKKFVKLMKRKSMEAFNFKSVKDISLDIDDKTTVSRIDTPLPNDAEHVIKKKPSRFQSLKKKFSMRLVR
ncbi:hypothetical protein HK098_004690 [Nowakowskiella sp. JEL0407]|nr:hypothetical protein HK098_004690 [Nowakowskiella sp. JEL0407]